MKQLKTELDFVLFIKKQLKANHLFKVLATKEQRQQIKESKLAIAFESSTEEKKAETVPYDQDFIE